MILRRGHLHICLTVAVERHFCMGTLLTTSGVTPDSHDTMLAKRKTLLIRHLLGRWKNGNLTALRVRHRVIGSNDQTIRVG
ncbi:hypothetical protein DPMN_063775 [Dreissena polymorpha]|uniref:Uncharacterized protein n=1 Tax=Dreissena polymorpha TaxID=45954 RepID=A0A9D4CB51_DREPO|nr:hypothetical protein DPMN_063775 [Dreissena polymorpha]